MEITDKLIDKLCDLAKLTFEAAEKEAFKSDLMQITAFFEQINDLDTDSVEPLIYLNDETNVMRIDAAYPLNTRPEALLNAPMHDNTHFLVPKVIKK